MTSTTDVLMLYQFYDPHPAHKVFGDAVNAEYRHFETGAETGIKHENPGNMLARLKTAVDLDTYDIVIGEGTTTLYTLLFYKLAKRGGPQVVPLIADETFTLIQDQWTHHLWKNVLGPIMDSVIAGGIAVSELAKNWAQQYLSSPFSIVHPSISNTKYELLQGAKSDYTITGDIDALHTGTVARSGGMAKKNVSTLANAVGDEDGIHLNLIGKGHSDWGYAGPQNITDHGYIKILDDFMDQYREADVYVQPSVGDAFPVASLEAMLAGLPTIVTTDTGTKEIVESVDSHLVRSPTQEGIKAGINYVANLSEQDREQIGTALRDHVAQLTEDNQGSIFRRELGKFTDQ